MATCEGENCGARVEWIANDRTGKKAPVDPLPYNDGNVVLSADRSTYRVLTKKEITALDGLTMFDEPPPDRFKLHFATCPDADHFRRDHVAHRMKS